MSTVPVPVRAATVAGTILAVIFITLSAVVGGVNVWRTRSAATYEAEASQAVSEKAAIDQQIIEAQTHLEAANAHRHKPLRRPSTPNAPTRSPWPTRSAHCRTLTFLLRS